MCKPQGLWRSTARRYGVLFAYARYIREIDVFPALTHARFKSSSARQTLAMLATRLPSVGATLPGIHWYSTRDSANSYNPAAPLLQDAPRHADIRYSPLIAYQRYETNFIFWQVGKGY